MNDAYCEQIVKRKLTPKLRICKLLIFLLAAFVIYTLIGIYMTNLETFASYGAFFFFLLFAVGWLCWRWSVSMNVEFEYIVTNGELDIDRIVSRRKRKRDVSVSTSELEQMAPYDDAHRQMYDTYECTHTFNAVGRAKDGGIWFIVADTRKLGKVRILFQPNGRVVENMRRAMPRKVLAEPMEETK